MDDDVLVHSRRLAADESGLLLDLPRERAGWEWMSLFVRRLAAGDRWETSVAGEEQAIVLLSGRCTVGIGTGARDIGERDSVFHGLPYAVYLPAGGRAVFQAKTTCEFAQCCVPS